MKRSLSGSALLAAVLAAFALHPALRGNEDPASRGLRMIDAKSLPAFKADFNGDLEAIRIVLLLSPT